MHFHYNAKCVNCWTMRVFETPIPSILILSSMCEWCGWFDMVGVNGTELCRPCLDLHKADVAREARHGSAKA